MGLARRLRRIARAHVADLRDELFGSDDSDPAQEGSGHGQTGNATADDRTGDHSAPESPSSSTSSETAVPPEVAEAYRALEVPVGSDRTTVKKGYRRVMKKYHQDRFDEDAERRAVAGEVSKRLNRAYQTVNDYLDERG